MCVPAPSMPAALSGCRRRQRQPRAPTPASSAWSRPPRRPRHHQCGSPTATRGSSWRSAWASQPSPGSCPAASSAPSPCWSWQHLARSSSPSRWRWSPDCRGPRNAAWSSRAARSWNGSLPRPCCSSTRRARSRRDVRSWLTSFLCRVRSRPSCCGWRPHSTSSHRTSSPPPSFAPPRTASCR